MYAHHVIEQLNDIEKTKKYDDIIINIAKFLLQNIVPKIRECEKIHLGDLGDLSKFFKSKIDGNPEMFKGYFSGVRLPFKSCWIDFSCPILRLIPKDHPFGKAPYNVSKRGMYCQEMFDDVISARFFYYIQELSRWEFSPAEVFISTNNIPLDNHLEFSNYLKPLTNPREFSFDKIFYDDNTIVARYTEDRKELMNHYGVNNDTDFLIRMTKNILPSLFGLNLGLSLLQCKNIITVKGDNFDKLNQKRIRNGKEPCYVFKTLMVKPLRYSSDSKNKDKKESQGLVKLHVAMGHFKTYTEEKPLFGKLVGKFWWQEQVRGNIKNGMVVKDYHLLTK